MKRMLSVIIACKAMGECFVAGMNKVGMNDE